MGYIGTFSPSCLYLFFYYKGSLPWPKGRTGKFEEIQKVQLFLNILYRKPFRQSKSN
jgi:hypothetical protein